MDWDLHWQTGKGGTGGLGIHNRVIGVGVQFVISIDSTCIYHIGARKGKMFLLEGSKQGKRLLYTVFQHSRFASVGWGVGGDGNVS